MKQFKPHLARALWIAPQLATAVVGALVATRLPLWLAELWLIGGEPWREARADGVVTHGLFAAALAALAMLVGLLGCAAGAFRTAPTLRAFRASNLVSLGILALFMYGAFTVVAAAQARFDGALANPDPGFLATYDATYWPASLLGLALLAAWVWSLKAATIGLYTGQTPEGPALGDRIIEDIRVFGRDPRYRGSWLSSAFIHVFILFILPWLMSLRGCVDPYYIPEGSGNPVVMLVQAVKPQKKKPREYILRPDSPISFDVPDLDDTEIEKEILKETEREYEAQVARVGKLGQGGGDEGGWPEGMGRHPVRFVRLEYRGREWDDGMGTEGADRAFLDRFEEVTGFEAARSSESVRMTQLDDFPKGFAPPFVYFTGDDSINVSRNEIKVLREYLLDGGMLFADAGHRSWDRSFRAFIRQVMPDKRLVDISEDDPIFRYPYNFPDGAPPVWAHGGRKCLGIKHDGRWIVFYHPGDLNDAWKGENVSGLEPHQTEGAFEMGLNIIYYAFTNYLEETKKYRKR